MKTSGRDDEMNAWLRDHLEKMTHDGDPVETYPAKLETLAKEIPHTIQVLPSQRGEPLDRYNCVMYALNLVGRMKNPFRVWTFRVDLAFLTHLIDDGYLTASHDPKVGGLVTWSSPEGLKHVGVLVNPDRAVSKWSIGQLLEHGLYEVPSSYGGHLAFYDPLDTPGSGGRVSAARGKYSSLCPALVGRPSRCAWIFGFGYSGGRPLPAHQEDPTHVCETVTCPTHAES